MGRPAGRAHGRGRAARRPGDRPARAGRADRRRPHRHRRARARPGRLLRGRAAAAALGQRAAAARDRGPERRAGPRRLQRPPRRPQPLLPLPDPRPQRALAVRARPRALAPVSVRRGRPARVRGAAAGRARLHRLHAVRRLPPALRAGRPARRLGAPRRRARVLDRGRLLHAQHEPRARRDDARARRRPRRRGRLRAPARGPPALGGRAAPPRRTGSTSSRCGTRLETDAAGAAHQRRRDRRQGAADAAARAAGARGRRAGGGRAGLQPLRHRPLDHLLAAAVGDRGRLRGRHEGLRLRRHAGRLRAARGARADRGLLARPGRLRDQPRLQPRRRHHLLRDGRGGAGGDHARRAGDRGLAAVAGARDGLPARRALRVRGRRPRSRRGSSTGSTTCRCPRARC